MLGLIFVIPDNCRNESELPEEMHEAFSAAKVNRMKPIWMHESEGARIEFQKIDAIVFLEFKGTLFEKALKQDCLIIGPQCLMQCLLENKPIPKLGAAVSNLAMENCIVCCSSLTKEGKKAVKTKVEYMAGIFTTKLVSNTTHLITDSVRTEKYHAAIAKGIEIMLQSFVNDVWDLSQKQAIHASDAVFKKHKCPVFQNLSMSMTGFKIALKETTDLINLITDNGGKVSKDMNLKTTDILICKDTSSAKYKAAVKHKIDCVSEEWIHDSIKKEYCLPNVQDYALKASTSTPTKGSQFCEPNFSMMSCIGSTTVTAPSRIDETIASTISAPVNRSLKRPSNDNDVIDSLDIKKAKLAGHYLDGCVIYLAGFSMGHNEKLCKIINFSGATRYDTLTDKTTHVIVGNAACPEMKLISSKNLPCSVVNVNWLIDSMNGQCPAAVEKYLVSSSNLNTSPCSQTKSPLSKKAISLLKGNNTVLEGESQKEDIAGVDFAEEDENILKQYLNSQGKSNTQNTDAALAAFSMPVHEEEEETVSMPSISISMDVSEKGPFTGLKFLITYTQSEEEILKNWTEELGGKVVDKKFKGIPDYAVVPLDFKSSTPIEALNVVTHLWIEECHSQRQLLPLQQYHKPFDISLDILHGTVFCLSGLNSSEKEYLMHAISSLGGQVQDCLAKFTIPNKDLLATTHLISAEASGKKYTAALKWGLPVVDKMWVFKCAEEKQMVDIVEFLIGESKAKYLEKNKTAAVEQSGQSIGSTTMTNLDEPQNNKDESLAPATTSKTPIAKLKEFNCEANVPDGFKTPHRNSPRFYSQVTPVTEAIARVQKMCDLRSPQMSGGDGFSTPPNFKPDDSMTTPDTPYGAFVQDPPPPELRKQFKRLIDKFSDRQRRDSTPLSEIKRRFWENLQVGHSQVEQQQQNTQNTEIDDCQLENENSLREALNSLPSTPKSSGNAEAMSKLLDNLENHLMASGGSTFKGRPSVPSKMDFFEAEHNTSREKVSQPLTVGWDDNMHTTSATTHKVFMISGVETEYREELMKKLENLGCTVSNLVNYDPMSTHLICEKLNRNEKLLASMAAGHWVLHTSYVEDSATAGKLLEEADYEFGNPKSSHRFTVEKSNAERAAACFYWREELKRRGYGAFHDIKAIVIGHKKDPLLRVLEAGGAKIVDASPPFTKDIYATHCFIELKKADFSEFVPLAKKGVLCLNVIYVNDFLTRVQRDVTEYIVPFLAKYY